MTSKIAGATLVVALCLVATPGAAAPKAKAVTVFEDAAGDAGINGSPHPGAAESGMDLTSATIERAGKDLVFTVDHAAMPASGSAPEAFRFLWHFNADGEEYRFTVKSFDVGKPDVIAQSGTERIGQIYATGVFRLEQCVVESAGVSLSNCTTLEYLEGEFDPAEMTFSFRLPLVAIKAKPGSTISAGTGGAAGTGCPICWVAHYAERSLTPSTVVDVAAQTVVYKVPKK